MLKNKRILMTGITGQVGESLAIGLAPHNEVWGLARFSKPGSRARVEQLGIRPLVCDYTNNDFEGVPDDFEYVLHVAASVRPKSSDEGMVENAEGTGYLLNHCRKAKGFIYVSTTGVYWDNADPYHAYLETDRLGGGSAHSPYYGVTKAAGEAVTRTVGRITGVPTTVLRLNVSYGRGGNGGLPGARLLDKLLNDEPINIPELWPSMHCPIYEQDMIDSIEPAFAAANLKTTIINWGGDDPVSTEDMGRYMAKLLGKEPKFHKTQEGAHSPRITENTKRQQLIGKFKVGWKEGFRRLIVDRAPGVQLHNVD